MAEENTVKTTIGCSLHQRAGELVGGGHFIFTRDSKTNRIHPSQYPYEHPSLPAARKEAERLAALRPGKTFVILSAAASITETPDLIDNDQFAEVYEGAVA